MIHPQAKPFVPIACMLALAGGCGAELGPVDDGAAADAIDETPDGGRPADATGADTRPSDARPADAQPVQDTKGGATDVNIPAEGLPVTFRYQPRWPGVTAVYVFGPSKGGKTWGVRATLERDAAGIFSGTAMVWTADYPYLFFVKGNDGRRVSAISEYYLDPLNPDIRLCPVEAPTQRSLDPAKVPQPCSYLAVPSAPAGPSYHVRGVFNRNGAPVPGWLIELQAHSGDLHHFVVDEARSATDGTYDFVVAAGRYQIRAMVPNFWKVTNDQRNPLAEKTLLGANTGLFIVRKDETLDPVETAFDYTQITPTMNDSRNLPVTFAFPIEPYADSAKVYVYPDWAAYIGRVLFEGSASGSARTVIWDGTLGGGGAVKPPRTVYWSVQQNARRGPTSPAAWYAGTMPLALQITN